MISVINTFTRTRARNFTSDCGTKTMQFLEKPVEKPFEEKPLENKEQSKQDSDKSSEKQINNSKKYKENEWGKLL